MKTFNSKYKYIFQKIQKTYEGWFNENVHLKIKIYFSRNQKYIFYNRPQSYRFKNIDPKATGSKNIGPKLLVQK
jgi:hypothetical protein